MFIDMVDVSLQNAFYLYKHLLPTAISALIYLDSSVRLFVSAQWANVGVLVDRAQHSGGWRVSVEVCLDRLNHLPVYIDKQKQCDVCKKKVNICLLYTSPSPRDS